MEDVKKALDRNNMAAHIVNTREEARELVMSMIGKDDAVGVGGSMTLDECGITGSLKQGYNYLDWHYDGIKNEDKEDILKKTLTCDVFLTSSNAITLDGKLYNIDGRGNRMAAFIYGPKKVIVVAGKNKIVKNLLEAKERLETITAPKNAKRLHKGTPCVEQGRCCDCRVSDRICCHTVITECPQAGRITVVLVNEELGI